MENFIDLLFAPSNLVLTCLLLLLVVYWVLTAVSGIDFDYDVDIDVDVDVDADVDFDAVDAGNMDFQDVASGEIDRDHIVSKRPKPLKWYQVFLVYFNFVGLPFMFTFTCWIFIWWLITITTTSITYSSENAIGHIIMLAALIPSLFVNKFFTNPFKGFFKQLNRDGDKAVDFIGRKAILASTISGEKMGNAEVVADGNPMSIYVKSIDGSELRFRESVLIIKQSDDKYYYLVSKG